MIQGTTESNLSVYIQTKDNRITTPYRWSGLTNDNIRHLFKFTRDIDDAVYYAYNNYFAYPATAEYIRNRWSLFKFTYNANPAAVDIYAGEIHLIPSGHYKYECYEVAWAGTPVLAAGNAPATETDVLSPPGATKGIVRGLVTKGLMYLEDKAGTEQVTYTQRTEPSGTNYIYYGQ